MYKLVINNYDDTHYWTEYADTEAALIAWYNEETTRPYWDHSRTYTITAINQKTQEQINADKLNLIKVKRDALLSACDFTQLPDAPLTLAQKQAWADYRQDLRDLPETITDLDNVTWPTKPE